MSRESYKTRTRRLNHEASIRNIYTHDMHVHISLWYIPACIYAHMYAVGRSHACVPKIHTWVNRSGLDDAASVAVVTAGEESDVYIYVEMGKRSRVVFVRYYTLWRMCIRDIWKYLCILDTRNLFIFDEIKMKNIFSNLFLTFKTITSQSSAHIHTKIILDPKSPIQSAKFPKCVNKAWNKDLTLGKHTTSLPLKYSRLRGQSSYRRTSKRAQEDLSRWACDPRVNDSICRCSLVHIRGWEREWAPPALRDYMSEAVPERLRISAASVGK